MRTLITTVACLICVYTASGCDICGCSMGGNYLGILPQYHRNSIGFRYMDQSTRSAHSRSRLAEGRYESEEFFHNYDLTARFYPFNRLQAMLVLPYVEQHKVESDIHTYTRGIGDASLMVNYLLFDTGDSLRRAWRQTLSVGGGLKLPTGNFNRKDSDGNLLNPNLQSGSGSFDFLLSATYTVRRGPWGLNASALGRINTTNRNDYYFGNRINGSLGLFYWKNLKKFSFLPNAGVFTDWSLPNYEGRSKVEGTGGHIALATAGMDVYVGKFSFGVTCQHPINQNLGEGKVQGRDRLLATLNFIF